MGLTETVGSKDLLAWHFDLMAFAGIEYHRKFPCRFFHGVFAEFIQLVLHQYFAVLVHHPDGDTGGRRSIRKSALAGDGTVPVVIEGKQRGVGLADASEKQPKGKNSQQGC